MLFLPSLLHVDEFVFFGEGADLEASALISQQMMATEWDCYWTSLEMAYYESEQEPVYWKLTKESEAGLKRFQHLKEKLNEMLSSLKTLTSREEFIRRIRTQLIVNVAKREGFQQIFVATSGTRLSIQLLTDISQGKGNQIHLETGFRDDRFDVPILRPLREFVSKEITFYNRMRNVWFNSSLDLGTKLNKKASLGKMTESFINGLQTEFPATVYTIFRIATKLRPSTINDKKCLFCSTPIEENKTGDCSAQASLQLSRELCQHLTLSRGRGNRVEEEGGEGQGQGKGKGEEVDGEGNPSHSSLLGSLCYGCSILLNDMNSSDGHQLFPPQVISNRNLEAQVVQEFILPD
jgi:cytoplasmic tRNA 2-thiolation protein 2